MASLTDRIKDFALELGYHAVGITSAEPFPQLQACLEARGSDYSDFPTLPLAVDPKNNLPEARSVIALIYDYATEGFPQELLGRIARLYQARCFLTPANRIHGVRHRLMRQFLEGQGLRLGPAQKAGIADRQAVVRAGVAQFGKNTFISVPKMGSFVTLYTIVVDVELDYGKPLEGFHCPPKCHACQDACPTGAIVADGRMVPKMCIALNNFITYNPERHYIPVEIREKMGTAVHGCDRCQEACPRNQPKLKARLPVHPFLEAKAREFDLLSLLRLTGAYYDRVVRPLMYNYIRDGKFFRRNAAIALGNLGDRTAVPALAEALRDPEEVVRAHVAWALGRLGGVQARSALESALSREPGEVARREIEEALAAIG